MPKLTQTQRERLERLKAMPDDEIDTSDIPVVADWSGAIRGGLKIGSMLAAFGKKFGKPVLDHKRDASPIEAACFEDEAKAGIADADAGRTITIATPTDAKAWHAGKIALLRKKLGDGSD